MPRMIPITRRQFLIRSGASVAASVIGGSLAGRVLAAARSGVAASGAEVAAMPAGPLGLDDPFLDGLASIVRDLEKKFPYASALYTAQTGVAIHRDRTGKRVSESGFPTQGVALRVFDGASFHETAVGSTELDVLHRAARELLTEVPLAASHFTIVALPAHSERWVTAMQRDPSSVSLADRAAVVDQEFERVNSNDPKLRSVGVTTDVGVIRRAFVSRTRRLASTITNVNHSVFLFGFDQGKPGFGFARNTGQGGLELAALTEAQLDRLHREFRESFTTEQVPAGEYDVVFAPSVSGLLAHESFGHGVEMDQFVKDRAKAREFLNKPVASSIVTLLDDPSVAGARGSYPFDDEGMVSGPTTIISNGVFVQPLTDLMSATFLGTPRTPNGRAQSWDHKVYARMSNTFFAKGSSDPAEMLAGLDGLYLEGFRNGIEDPQGWGIQFTASTAREYKNGKPTGKLYAPATVTGYVPDILSKITAVGNDWSLEPGTCGKGFKEWVPVTSGGPHLRTRARVS